VRLFGVGRAALAGAIGLTVGGCQSGCRTEGQKGGAVGTADAAVASAPDATADAPAPMAPRCTEGRSFALDVKNLELGEAHATPAQIVIGAAFDKDGGRRAGYIVAARAGDDVTAVRLEPAGDLAPDAPPPGIAVVGGAPLVARYPPGSARELAVGAARIPQQSDDSFGFDLAPNAIAWDEFAVVPGWPVRGVIKVLSAPFDARRAVIVSPEGSDADSPRVIERAGGYWIAWIARRPEPERDGAAPEVEGPGEARAFRWIEAAALDANGALVGAPRRIAASRRVEAFDLSPRDGGAALDLLVKDDEEPSDAAGARLLVVTLRGDGALLEEETRVLVPDGIGDGVPDRIGPWAAYTDRQDRAWLVPVEAVASGGRPSPEPSLDGGRPLAALGTRIFAAYPADPAHALRVLTCAAPL
jgi:hypothetical protein